MTWSVAKSGPAVPDFSFENPPDANDGQLFVWVGIPSLEAGTVTSADGSQCGSAFFTYYLPIPSWVTCDAGAPPNCPPGCGTGCSGFGCLPCTPEPPSVTYSAEGSSDCSGGSTTPFGSWQLSLTSTIDAGTLGNVTRFAPHGSFTASLPIFDGGADNAASVSVSF